MACQRSKYYLRLFVLSALLAFAAAFTMHGAEVTFSHDVAPILYKHCVTCHHPNDVAPMSLLTYRDARPWAAAMKQAVVTGKMPPWKADPRYGKWSNDARLTPAEIMTIRAWADERQGGRRSEGTAGRNLSSGGLENRQAGCSSFRFPSTTLRRPARTNTLRDGSHQLDRGQMGASRLNCVPEIAKWFITLTSSSSSRRRIKKKPAIPPPPRTRAGCT